MRRKSLHYKTKAKILLAFASIGFLVFYVLPFILSLRYAVINDNFRREFVGLENFKDLFANPYFRLALKNTLIFTSLGVTMIVLFSTCIAILQISAGKKFAVLRIFFILPMLLPTAGIAMVWRALFNAGGALTLVMPHESLWYTLFGVQIWPIYIIFIWKYSGINIILITGAISGIDPSVYEAAALDGAYGFTQHRYITAPLIRPTLFFTILLSIVNAFRIYKEVFYLYGGEYPPDAAYFVQHFMNNQFMKLNYQMLSSAAITFFVIILCIVLAGYLYDTKKARE